MQPGDVIIDGGNTSGRTISAAARRWPTKGMHYLDVGTSGGVWGIERGYCMMIGGDKDRRRPSRSDLQDAGAGHRRHSADARPRA
jgi:6-phosphogluconate dehydrogenase (decarboxylating)